MTFEDEQQAFEDERPKTLTVNGAGLLAFGKRTDCHIYRMMIKGNGIYELHLLWLDGRQMVDIKGNAYRPMRGESKHEAMKAGLGEFGEIDSDKIVENKS